MTVGEYLFSFNGRANRAKWWLLLLIQIGAAIAYYTALCMLMWTSVVAVVTSPSAESVLANASGSILIVILLCLAYCIGMFIISLAVTVKRLHDRNRGGAWILVFALGPWLALVCATLFAITHSGALAGLSAITAVVISFWGFIELGCLRGTIGDNRFGVDPLAPLYPASMARPTPAGPPTSIQRPTPVSEGAIELAGLERLSEYYLKIDAAELADMSSGLIMGRDPASCGFVVDDDTISRSHARLSFRDGNYILEDLGSTNGTRLNGRALVRFETSPLRSGDRVVFGSAVFGVQFVR
jgi:uncharacterized membrane protein YhaH (DUF805 family)